MDRALAVSIFVDAGGAQLEVRNERGSVAIDASTHELYVDSHEFGVVALGASSPGVAAATGLALDELGAERGEREVADAIIECLRRAAARSPRGAPVDRYAARGLRLPPLTYAGAFLRSPFYARDLERFFPFRIALAHVEDGVDDSSIDSADACVARLESWRGLFSPTGEGSNPLHATLTDFGELGSAHALWGLRGVALTKRVATLAHLEVLGALGRHPRAHDRDGLAPHMRAVELASAGDLADAIREVPRRLLGIPRTVDDNTALAELVALVPNDDARAQLRLLVRDALALAQQCPRAKSAVTPSVPLPSNASIRFLATAGDIVDEGIAMGHCVGTRAPRAVAGLSYYFHVDLEGEPVTVEVDANTGRVTEARGLNNTEGLAVVRAQAWLARWGRSLVAGATPLSVRERIASAAPSAAASIAVRVHRAAVGALTDQLRGSESASDTARTLAGGVLSLFEDPPWKRRRR